MKALKTLGRILVLGLACAASAAAQTPPQQSPDQKTIADCVTAANAAGQFGGQCIGIVAEPCIAKLQPDIASIQEARRCAARELAIWTELMALWLQGTKPAGDDLAEVTGKAQKAFTESLETICPVFDHVDPERSVGGANYCLLQETARRALILKRLSDAVARPPR